jgi:hypothetical protein
MVSPDLHGFEEAFPGVRDGRPSFTRVPAPQHQRCAHVLHNLFDGSMAILLRILQQFAELMVAQALPDHRHRRRGQTPFRRSRRHVNSRQVVLLMTGAALDRVHAMPVRTTPHIHDVRMRGVALHFGTHSRYLDLFRVAHNTAGTVDLTFSPTWMSALACSRQLRIPSNFL